MNLAFEYCRKTGIAPNAAVIAGGVAANKYIRSRLQSLCEKQKTRFAVPPIALCTDNGAMIAWAGIEKFQKGQFATLDFKPRPRWPLGSAI